MENDIFYQDLPSIDVFRLFEKIEPEFEDCFILESLGDYSDQSRYTVIGFAAEKIIRSDSNNDYNSLKKILPDISYGQKYTGGLVGYMTYDAAGYFEPTLKLKTNQDFGRFLFGYYTDGIIFDKLTGKTVYFFRNENRYEKLKKIIRCNKKNTKPNIRYEGDSMSQSQHRQKVEAVKEHIKSGDIFQIQIGFKQHFTVKGNNLQIYKTLREINPSPYMYYLKFSGKTIIGASPELLFRMIDGYMETFPLAGTIRRGKNEFEDMRLRRELLENPKELAEHSMLIDLHRNDIGKISRFGTVKIRKMMDVKKFSHVQHISSEISGLIKNGEDMFSALAANFPAGTLTGTPKIEAMKLIDKYESTARGPYGGAVGYFGNNGDCTFAIPIRTIFISGNNAFSQASGGIVYDSTSAGEYQEIINKLGAIKKVMSLYEK